MPPLNDGCSLFTGHLDGIALEHFFWLFITDLGQVLHSLVVIVMRVVFKKSRR